MASRSYSFPVTGIDNFSATFSKFVEQTTAMRAAWVSFLGVARKPANIGGFRRDITAIASANRGLKGVGQNLNQVATGLNKVGAATRKTAEGSKTTAKNTRDAGVAARKAARETRLLGQNMGSLTRRTGGWNVRLKRSLAILGRIFTILAIFKTLQFGAQLFSAAIKSAFGFSDALKRAELSIAGLFTQLTRSTGPTGKLLNFAERFAAAQGVAREQTKALRLEALNTAATFEQLLDTFQVGIAPGLVAGLGIDQIRKLATLVSQAAGAVGVPQNQLSEEIRSLLTGNIRTQTSRIAVALDIDRADIDRAKELGNLFEFLQERLEFAGVVGSQSLKLIQVQLVNLAAAASEALSIEFAETINVVLAKLIQLNALLVGSEGITIPPALAQGLSAIDDLFQQILISAQEIGGAFGPGGLEDSITSSANAAVVLARVLTPLGVVVAHISRGFFFVADAVADTARVLSNVLTSVLSLVGAKVDVPFINVFNILGGILFLLASVKVSLLVIRGITATWKAIQSGVWFLYVATELTLTGINNKIKLVTASTVTWQLAFLPLLAFIVLAIGLWAALNTQIRAAIKDVATTIGRITTLLGLMLVRELQKGFGKAIVNIKASASLLATDLVRILGSEVAQGILKQVEGALGTLPFIGDKVAAGVKGARVALKLLKTTSDLTAKSAEELGNELTKAFKGVDDQANAQFSAAVASLGLKTLEEEIALFIGTTIDLGDVVSKEVIDALNAAFNGVLEVVRKLGEDAGDGLIGFASPLKTVEDELQRLRDSAIEADLSLQFDSNSSGLRGMAAAIIKVRSEIEKASTVVKRGLNKDLAQTVAQIQALEDGPSNAETLQLTLNALERKALLQQRSLELDSEIQALTSKRVQLLALEFSIRSKNIQQGLQRQLELERGLARIRREGVQDAQAEREGNFKSNILRLKDTASLAEEIHDEEIAALRAEALQSGNGLQARLVLFTAINAKVAERILARQIEQRLLDNEIEQLEEIKRLESEPEQVGTEAFLKGINDTGANAAQFIEGFLRSIRDGLASAVAGGLVEGLFDGEANFTERFRNLMKSLAQIVIEEFLKVKVLDNLFRLGLGGGGDKQFSQGDTIGPVFAQGGFVPGGSAESLSGYGTDTVAAALTPGEMVIKKATVGQGSRAFWEALNAGRVNIGELERFVRGKTNLPTPGPTSRSKRRYQTGGQVGSGSFGAGGVTIINVHSEEQLAAAMAGQLGQRVIVNTVSAAEDEQ